ncbi:glycoside hydrolase domain-containing protein [Bacillus sp. CGMCC 1.16541]|uniref:glycoside hydrolase domain-containing protein n=1 Tax=Bacillus sp. CGMCC 1.16541 TaxID=2185143 RepID=UPI001EF67B5E|nr:glycoside hydrolase domain-containing protein [Bacillus sp. CGMCC 1.16541]
MNEQKSYVVMFAAFLCTLTLVTVFFLYDTGTKQPSSHQLNASPSSESSVQNEVQNTINHKGDGTINNNVTNSVEVDEGNTIANSLANNIDVSVNVTIENSVTNNVKTTPPQSSESSNQTDETKASDKTNETNTSIQKGNKENENQPNKQRDSQKQLELVWGIDSASDTTEEFNSCVRKNFGNPAVWGRYLGDKNNVSKGVTKDEASFIQSTGAKVLLIYNQFKDARGYESGKEQAQLATKLATDLGVPDGVAIFADIEPNYPVDADFIVGWFETMTASPYKPGIYGIFDAERELTTAFEEASKQNEELKSSTYLWTAAPNMGITTEKNAPNYQPEAPKDALVAGWQYGIDAEQCNIDTNLFTSEALDVLW